MLTTLLLPTGGRATVAGHDVVHEARAVRGSIGVAPATFVFLIGAGFPGIDGLLIAYPMVVLMAAFAACWDAMLALVFLTPAYAPLAPLQGGSTTWPRSTR